MVMMKTDLACGLSGIFLVVIFAVQQGKALRAAAPGTPGYHHLSPSSSSSSHTQHRTLAHNLTRLDRKVQELEHKITQRVDESLQSINRKLHSVEDNNSRSAVAGLSKLVNRLQKELETSQDLQKEQAETIRHLKHHVDRQRHDLQHMRGDLEKLRHRVANLTVPLKRLLAAGTAPVTGSRVAADAAAASSSPANDKPPTVPFKPLYPKDCQDVIKNGMVYPGFYYISIQPYISRAPFKVCCQMTNESGWTLIQRRQDGSVDFYRTWYEYKKGFGDLEEEFWLGNDHIYAITNQGDYKLRIEMTDWNDKKYYAEYDHFRISSEDDKFRLHVHGYDGNAGDSLTSHWENHNDQPFSTKDNDNDDRFYDNCAEHYHGAWWFKSCFESHLNGVFYKRGTHSNYFVRNGIQWNSIHMHSSLKYVAMMIKPNPAIKEAPFTEDEPNGV